jgi:hypothetical protein
VRMILIDPATVDSGLDQEVYTPVCYGGA